MIITIGKKKLYFNLNDKSYESEGYRLIVKDLRDDMILSSRIISQDDYLDLVEVIRPYMV